MANTKKTTKKKNHRLHQEILKQMITLSTSGFGLVAALAWNNVIQELVKTYINKWLPQGGSLFSLLLYAIAITTIAVFITYQLSKLIKLNEDE